MTFCKQTTENFGILHQWCRCSDPYKGIVNGANKGTPQQSTSRHRWDCHRTPVVIAIVHVSEPISHSLHGFASLRIALKIQISAWFEPNTRPDKNGNSERVSVRSSEPIFTCLCIWFDVWRPGAFVRLMSSVTGRQTHLIVAHSDR